MITKKSDDAVSPVIGVMLMLVVTVVIAAAVTIFATGVVGETEPAPVSVLDVEIFSNVFALDHGLSGPNFWITHLSGDAVDTKDIEIRLS
ncbi:MAG: type IV pilin [Methanocorpusculum sp.]|jgi:FlaG/FlaF family flagellin (archaellin)|nr:type IV pilin [Methanocorpusculum sp.]